MDTGRSATPRSATASDIFASQRGESTDHQPRKIKDNQKSSIFSHTAGDDHQSGDNAKRNNFLSPRYQENTKQRLFGGEQGADLSTASSPRRINDTWRSSLGFSASVDNFAAAAAEDYATPRRSPGVNPITGRRSDDPGNKQQQNGFSSPPIVNGNGNGPAAGKETNGGGSVEENGNNVVVGNGEMMKNQSSPNHNRQPPGGRTNGIF